MKTRFIIAFVLVPAISRLCDTTWAIGGNMGGGDGSSATPYLIEDFADFQTFTLPAHAAAFWAAGVHTRLEADLDLNPALPDRQIYDSAVIAPDANSLAWDFQGPSFAGVFDGNRYRIRNLTIHIVGAENGYLGLFGYIDPNGELKYLVLENTHITIESSGSSVGGVCGENHGLIQFCTILNPVIESHDSMNIGGVCGQNFGTITNNFTGNAIINGNDNLRIGGLCGANHNLITTSYTAAALLNGESNLYLGGVCGANAGTINNSYAAGATINQIGSNVIGGLCGWDYYGYIDKCYAVGVAGGDNLIGGVCGYRTGSVSLITNCFWDVDVSGIADPEAGLPDTDGMIGKTTAEMHTMTTFLAADWEFTASEETNGGGDSSPLWIIRENLGYPQLAWKGFLPGDVAGDYSVNLTDFAAFAAAWQTSAGDPNFNPDCDLDTTPPSDNTIDLADWIIFCQNWLAEIDSID